MVESSRFPTDEAVLRILIIEDNPGDIIIVRERLKASGANFSLKSASSIMESISLLNSDAFDVILLDLGLPDSFGLDTLKVFQSYQISQPVVVMTGLDNEVVALSALREGAQDYLVKSKLNSENILRSIKYGIERKKLENLQKKNSRQLSILSAITVSLSEGEDIAQIYVLICDSIRQLVNKSYVASIEFDDEVSIRITNSEQFKPWSKDIASLTGLNINDIAVELAGMRPEIPGIIMDGCIHKVKGGLFELTKEKISVANCMKLEKLTGINHIYTVGFHRNESYYGGIFIFCENLIEEDDIKFIENLCGQASLNIHRRLIMRNLVISEARYQKLAGELEEKVLDRTAELEIANVQLRKSEAKLMELNATKDKFFNIVAHDLKNPFTSLLGATELLFHNIDNMEREKIRKLAQILNDSAKSGYAILLNLLDWSRSQTGLIKINLQKINLSSIIDDNIAELHLNSVDKQITLVSELRENINIITDKNMLNTVLRNLLSNAIKFTPRRGRIVVSSKISDNEVFISVKDNGIGISAENIDKLFRIDSKYTRPGTEKEIGTGLGLKLSREFVEKLGGKIWVESSEETGSEFIFSIPRQVNAYQK